MFDPQDARPTMGWCGHGQRTARRGSRLGRSTLVASKAAALNAAAVVQCIEPYPNEFFNRHLTQQQGYELIQKRVQDVDLSVFAELAPGDVLFIDSLACGEAGQRRRVLSFKSVAPPAPWRDRATSTDIVHPSARYDKAFFLDCHWYWNENYIVAALLAAIRVGEFCSPQLPHGPAARPRLIARAVLAPDDAAFAKTERRCTPRRRQPLVEKLAAYSPRNNRPGAFPCATSAQAPERALGAHSRQKRAAFLAEIQTGMLPPGVKIAHGRALKLLRKNGGRCRD